MISFEGIAKSFGEAKVLRDVSFSMQPGELVGLVGENGAGKSTLMNILGGNVIPDAGRMLLSGQFYQPRSPRDAAAAGIAFIHQELNLFPNLSLAENLFLTRFPAAAGILIKQREIRSRAAALLEQVGLECSPDALVEQLSPGQRQLLEVAKSLGANARLLIFDEPTTSLSAKETQVLFALVRKLRAAGASIIYISHALQDVLSLSDAIVVLRDGAVAGSGRRADFDTDKLVSLMVGRNITQFFPPRGEPAQERVLLEVQNLTEPGIARNISFKLHAGEVLGIAGLMGAGRSEMARILFGLDACREGKIRMDGEPLDQKEARRRIAQGMAFVTEDRREEGLCMSASIGDNIALVTLREHCRPASRLVRFQTLRDSIAQIRHAVRLSPAAKDQQPVRTLSGGNQQKVVLAKWLLAKPRVLILDEPTRGIDVGAKFEIYQLIRRAAAQGAGILLISSELEELIGLADRIIVMARGEIRDEVPRPQFDRERILRAALRARETPCPEPA